VTSTSCSGTRRNPCVGIFFDYQGPFQEFLSRVQDPQSAAAALPARRAARTRVGAVVQLASACGHGFFCRATRRFVENATAGLRRARTPGSSSTARPYAGIQSRLRIRGPRFFGAADQRLTSRSDVRLPPLGALGYGYTPSQASREALLTDLFTCPQGWCRRITERIAANPIRLLAEPVPDGALAVSQPRFDASTTRRASRRA